MVVVHTRVSFWSPCIVIFWSGIILAGGDDVSRALRPICCGDDSDFVQTETVSPLCGSVDHDGELPGDCYRIAVAPEPDQPGFFRRATRAVGAPVRGVRFLLALLWYCAHDTYAQGREWRRMTEEEKLVYILTEGECF